jgi:hypothetical protein
MENHQFSQCPATPEIQTCSCLAPAAGRLSKVKAKLCLCGKFGRVVTPGC